MNAQIEQLTSETVTLETQHSEKTREHENEKGSLMTKIEHLMKNISDLQEMVESKDKLNISLISDFEKLSSKKSDLVIYRSFCP